MTYRLESSDIQVQITKKKIRSFRLRIDRTGRVLCSLPYPASYAKAIEFIESKAAWIIKNVEKVKTCGKESLKLSENSLAYKGGLGEEDYLADGEGERSYSKKWKNLALSLFLSSLKKNYSYFQESGLSKKMPEFEEITLKGRKMKSMWGNCNRLTKTVTLNYELLRFPQICLDYVALHELTHFIYIYHDKNFYSTVEKFMPDYKSVVKMMM
ncbi:MAG: M48 family metallopeptidase [Treponema sp.]|nr:M48 family metallopeptidase [Treponema sp.]